MNIDEQHTETDPQSKQTPEARFLIEQLRLVAMQSLHYKNLSDKAKTTIKKEFYKKKLKKNNQLAAGILVLLEREGVEFNKETFASSI